MIDTSELIDYFENLATLNKSIAHNPDVYEQNAFLYGDLETLLEDISGRNSSNFIMLLETGSGELTGPDEFHLFDSADVAFVICKSVKQDDRAMQRLVERDCKKIGMRIVKRIQRDRDNGEVDFLVDFNLNKVKYMKVYGFGQNHFGYRFQFSIDDSARLAYEAGEFTDTSEPPPVFSVLPALNISGNHPVGAVITCSPGTVVGIQPITRVYQWKRNGVNFVNNSNQYTTVIGDVGTVITCSVTATNEFGFATALTSNSVTVTAVSAIVATGGTITYAGGKTIHTFTSSGNFNVSFAPPGAVIDALIIAGGGGGGVYFGAGGGAGGVIQLSADALVAGNYPVVVGAGGAAATSIVFKGSNGNNTTFKGNTAIGGGGGGSGAGGASEANGANGGSGGGGAGAGTGGTGNVGQGYNGIGGYGGSGGGAGGNPNVVTGNAGVGISSAISGTSLFYAGGGGGATKIGGSGVGGNGSDGSNIGLTAPTPNTGSGGGGMWSNPNVLGAGAAGVVIISYNTI